MAGDCRPIRPSPQLPTPGLFLTPQRSHCSGHRRVSPGVGWPSGVHVSTFWAHLPGHQQTEVIQGDLSDAHRSILATEGIISGAPESCGGSSVAPSFTLRLIQIAHFHHLHQNLPVLSLHVWRLFSGSHAT